MGMGRNEKDNYCINYWDYNKFRKNLSSLGGKKDYILVKKMLILRLDGSTLFNYGILPSAFVSFEQIYKDDKLEKIVFYGGGNGHGVGMSQYGVVGMIRAGYQLEEIISHYYEGAQIKVLY